MAAVVSWAATVMYSLAAQAVATLSVIEIGPNLLAAITSIIGCIVLLGQVYLAQRVKKVDHVEKKADENAVRIDAIEEKKNGDG